MSVKWTVLACVAVPVLAVGAIVALETAHGRTAARWKQFANWPWPVIGVAIGALWAWNIAGRRTGR